jgi:hypothetical protein
MFSRPICIYFFLKYIIKRYVRFLARCNAYAKLLTLFCLNVYQSYSSVLSSLVSWQWLSFMMTYLFWRKDTPECVEYQKIMYEGYYILKVHILDNDMPAKVWVGIRYIKWARKLFFKYRLLIVTEGASYIGLHEKTNLSVNSVF